MAVSYVESAKCKVERHRRVVKIAEWRSEHANSVKRDDPTRWKLVLLQLCRADEITLNHFSYFRVAREAEHDLINYILEYKILVVVGCC